MRQTDIAIIGGGLAGSIAATMLGRAGISAVLIEPNQLFPPDFRCEKLAGGPQLDRLRRTGLADVVLPATTYDGGLWIARFGRLIEKRPGHQYGIRYDTLVNTVRAAIPPAVETIHARATALATGTGRQTVTLAGGEQISARLVVLATGPATSVLAHQLGITRRVVSRFHSVSIGFDMAPAGRDAFAFPALTYFAEDTVHRTAYLTMFPIGDTMRANLFVYREAQDPWLTQFRRAPEATMDACLPRLRDLIGDYTITGEVRIRPGDLYDTEGHRQAGVVLVGDAFMAPCPCTGTGTDKVFTDVERLCNVHIPAWLRTPGMGADKIAAFYDDPDKVACDAWSRSEAYRIRAMTTDDGAYWRMQRWIRFLGRLALGFARDATAALGFRDVADAPAHPPHGDEHARDILRALGFHHDMDARPKADSAERQRAAARAPAENASAE
ncbi:MAG: NAD(P)/FAD-dependent oxidoreductase [Xanthobacteraceae bacterium]|nr:NAD(P)/FAD-dependent oxidoreductase [Xanthobacteraceae bacterium]